MRKFRVIIRDLDGEEYSYEQNANTVWECVKGIDATMMIQGNFYGHVPEETMDLKIEELITLS